MRNLIGILVAIGLAAAGVGVVRPHTIRLIDEAWEPVVEGRLELPLTERAPVELSQLGDYLVFLEGPASDPLWSTAGGLWIQLLDRQSGRPLDASRHGADFSYELDGRRAQALSRVAVSRTGTHELSLGSAGSTEFHTRGFQLTLSPASLVVEQSRRATSWLVAGIAAGIVMGIFALSMLSTRES
jgi:hypothetical protein